MYIHKYYLRVNFSCSLYNTIPKFDDIGRSGCAILVCHATKKTKMWCLTLFVNVVTIINRSAISILSAQWRRLSDSQRDNKKDCKCPP